MTTYNFLVEIGTEELPPKSLRSLSEAFTNAVKTRLTHDQLGFEQAESFCTPRRLAVRIRGLE